MGSSSSSSATRRRQRRRPSSNSSPSASRRGRGIDVGSVTVLVPQHKGAGGTKDLNARLQERLNPKGRELARGSHRFRVGDRVLQTKNDYFREIFNGDVGRVTSINKGAGEITVEFDGREVVCDDEAMDRLTLAYAMSIHKAQGSEYPAVVIYLGEEHEHMLGRNLFYTAATRGRTLVMVVATKRSLAMAVREQRRDVRRTKLAERLKALLAS